MVVKLMHKKKLTNTTMRKKITAEDQINRFYK